MPRHTILTALAVSSALAAGCGSGKGGATTATRPAQAPAKPVAKAWRVRVRRVGRMPAPVQLPATTTAPGGGARALGGLDAGDASSAAIVRVTTAGAHEAGTLPAALHDA